MPWWFFKKVFLKNFGYIFLILVLGFTGSYLLFKYHQDFWGFSVFVFSLVLANYFLNDYKNKKHGVDIEKRAYSFLKKNLPFDAEIDFRKPLKTGGDIDIYIRHLDIGIDVKSFKKLDDRIFSDKNQRSYKRQLRECRMLIIWLPDVNDYVGQVSDNLVVICGREPILKFLSQAHIKKKNFGRF